MAIFIYQPKFGLSNLTCDQGEDVTNAYQVLPSSIDMNEQARLEIVYAEGKIGGTVRGTKAGLVPIKHQILVKGTSPENVESNARVLKRVLADINGGYLQYRPLGWNSAMSTYYHYLPSKPPKVIRRGLLSDTRIKRYCQVHDETYTDGIIYEIELMTEAWATSDPTSLVTVVAVTGIYNHDDAGHNNYVNVPSSSIKGDAVFPVVKMIRTGGTVPYNTTNIFVYRREMIVGANTNLDWFEAEDVAGGGWTTPASGLSSAGEHARYVGVGSSLIFIIPSTWDETYKGKFVLVVSAHVDSGSTFTIQPKVNFGGARVIELNTIELVGHALANWKLLIFDEVDLPPYSVPDHATLSDYWSVYVQVDVVRTAGSGGIDVDFMVAAKADLWIMEGYADTSGGGLDHTGTNYLLIDYLNESLHIFNLSDELSDASYSRYGPSFKDLILRKGMDHRFRFMGSGFDASHGDYTIDPQYNITVYGLYGTVYPFEEA